MTWIAALIALFVLAVALFLPFGLRRLPWHDTWQYFSLFQEGIPYAIKPDTRPLNHLIWGIAYVSSAHSFIAVNAIIFAAILLRGALIYGIARRLTPNNHFIALSASLLAMAFPAEVGYFNDAYLNLHVGFDTYLAALFFLLAYWRSQRPLILVLSIILLTFSVFTYEAVHALIFAAPLLLLWMNRRISRRLIVTSIIWLIPQMAYLVYLFILIMAGVGLNTRESKLLSTGLSQGLGEILSANLYSLQRQFFGDWLYALRTASLQWGTESFFAALITVTFVSLFAWWSIRRDFAFVHADRRRIAEMLLIGILFAAAGFFIMSLSSIRSEGVRTAFYSSFGVCLTLGCALSLIAHASGRLRFICFAIIVIAGLVFYATYGIDPIRAGLFILAGFALCLPLQGRKTLLLGVLLLLCTVRLNDLHRWLANIGLYEQHVLTQMMRSAPRTAENAVLVLWLPENLGEAKNFFVNSQWFDSTLEVAFANVHMTGLVCHVNASAWGWQAETCTIEPDGLHLNSTHQNVVYAYDRLIVFEVQPDGSVTLQSVLPSNPLNIVPDTYRPDRLRDASAPLPPNYYTMFDS